MHTEFYASTPHGAGSKKIPLAPLAATTTSQALVPDGQPDAFYFRALEEQGIFLNKAQIEAVRHGDGPLLTLAGAGSGKTSVLVCRTGYLIAVRGISPRSILLVTFSSKAAAEMKQRIAGLPGMTPRMAGDVQARTYHSFFLLLLRRQGYDQDILSETRYQHIIVKRMLREMGLQDEYQPETLLAELSHYKMNLIDIDDVPEKTADERNIKSIFRQYEQWKKTHHKMDFDDVLLYAHQLLLRSPHLLQSLQERFVYVMNDEFQDTNRLQYELVQMIAAPQHNFMVVGDDDQTIYSFNGASHEYILDFHKLYPTARTVTLDINYRSTSSIVGLGNEVIRRNKKRKPKQLQATRSSDTMPRYYRPGDSNEEAQAVIARITEDVAQRQRSYSDFAILYRSASDSRALLEQLVLREVPFVHYGGGDVFYEQWMVKPVIDYLRLSLHRRNFEAMEGILPTLYINRDKGMEFIRQQEAVQRKKGPLAYLLFFPELKDFQKDKLRDRLAQIKTFAQMKPVDAIRDMRRTFYDAFLETSDSRKLTPHKEVLKETLDELESAAKPFASTAEFVEHVELMIRKHKEMELLRQDAEADRVTVMTIHKSKGLEFPVVFVIGVSDGMLPHSSALEQPNVRGEKAAASSAEEKAAALEEERRLAYVAITRAREELILSSPAYFRGKKAEVSQFILAPFRQASPQGTSSSAHGGRLTGSSGGSRPKDLTRGAAVPKPPVRTVSETVYAWVCTAGSCNAWSRISTPQETKVKDKACPLCHAPMRRGSKTVAVRQG
ncbi:UvrD-helicase domain-containing protein [Paenibacillus rigui]|uniref:DNA 3'-5' helicase n=1 Tax=Paenibacillus rigui TaxID=554312 RepID=A0A229UNI8_9BACL|nr:UvrD-helicase domain-containing protein [Paenibacillus rigui]OXM84865.1 DNA helicase UvrD [Paenibacillus rigui]